MSDATILRMRPAPLMTRVTHHRTAQGVITAVMRQWRPGDTSRCSLCQSCTAFADGCLIQVSGHVSRDDAAWLSTHGRKVQSAM